MAEVHIAQAGPIAGVWVGNEQGILGLVAQDGLSPIIAIYPPGTPIVDIEKKIAVHTRIITLHELLCSIGER